MYVEVEVEDILIYLIEGKVMMMLKYGICFSVNILIW